MKERLQNLMQNLSKKRLLSIVLVLALLVTSIPLSMLGDNTAYAKAGANFGALIGNTAKFNTKNFPDALVTNDPYNFDMNSWEDAGDENNRVYFSNKESLEGVADSYGELPLVITNYYHNEETKDLWYKVEAGPGYELPSRLAEKPWVYQNNTRNYDDSGKTMGMPDALLIDQDGATYVFDEEGNRISELDFYAYEAHKLSAGTTLQGSVDYQWQIYSDGEWINIYKENKKEFRLSWGIVKGLLDEDLTTKVRVVTTSGSRSLASEAVTVNYVQPLEDEEVATFGLRSTALDNQQLVKSVAADASEKAIITVKFVYGETGEQIDDDEIFEVQKNSTLTKTFTLPVLAGYDAYLEDDTETIYTEYTIDETVTEDKTITFKYWPAKVDYTVIYYWQNVDDDEYTEHERYTTQGFTGSMTEVDDKEYAGFYQLLYENVEIASDGSTVIEVYYDRDYFKMLFNLDGGYGVQPIYARYETPVQVSNPTKAGYTFVGWDDITNVGDEGPDGIANALPETVPAFHTAFKAIWKATDQAKVTIVYWGENANDEGYSYIESQEIYAAPGTELTYGTNNPICGLEPHSHGNNCETDCGLTAHTHSDAENCYGKCAMSNHTHDETCYTITYRRDGTNYTSSVESVTNNNTITQLERQDGWNNGIVNYNYGYYMKLNGVWYKLDTSGNRRNPNSGATVTVTYKNGCSNTHTHDDKCVSCTTPVHSHVADCYLCIEHRHTNNCYLQGTNLDSNLWTYVESETVTVAADGSTVMNVYYDRVQYKFTYTDGGNTVHEFSAKWDSDISKKWSFTGTNGVTYPKTNQTTSWTPQNSNTYTQRITMMVIMPAENITFRHTTSSNTRRTFNYYIEALPGETGVHTYGSKQYHLYLNLPHDFNYTYYNDDFFKLEGFDRDVITNGNGSVVNLKANGSMSSISVLNFHYNRKSYTLDFNNGEDITKTESVLYEANLGTYSTYVPPVPERYEPGSVVFAGWYQNPQCTGEEVVLSEETMPASNKILYAKWAPVTHKVRFFHDETVERTDYNVYTQTVDGETVKYMSDIQHGSRIEGDKVPADPTRGQYIFVGWFYEDANGNEQMWDFDNTTVTRDTDIYAKWSSNTLVPYTVKFVYVDANGNEIEIADRITGSALGGNSKTFDAKGNAQLYEDYQQGYFPTTKSHTIVMDLENPANNTFTFYYEKRDAVPYTVYYVTETQDGGLTPVEINGVTYYIVAETKTVADNKKAIVTETYKKVSGYLPETYQQTLTIDPNGNNIIVFKYNKDNENGMYVVHYWTKEIDGTYSEHSIFEGRGAKNSTVTATIKDIENFTYDEGHENEVLSGTISVENVLELHVYYDRNAYPYKVQYLEEGSNKPLAGEKIVTDKLWEEYVTENAIPIDGYIVSGNATKSIQIRKDTENPTVNIITFYYIEEKSALTIKKNYPEGADYSIDENQTFIFTIKGADVANNDKAKAVDMTVTIHGDGEVKITELPAGTYIVTENADWSWRYEAEETSKTVQLEPGVAGRVEFKNTRNENNWLDGDHSVVNIFDGNNQ